MYVFYQEILLNFITAFNTRVIAFIILGNFNICSSFNLYTVLYFG